MCSEFVDSLGLTSFDTVFSRRIKLEKLSNRSLSRSNWICSIKKHKMNAKWLRVRFWEWGARANKSNCDILYEVSDHIEFLDQTSKNEAVTFGQLIRLELLNISFIERNRVVLYCDGILTWTRVLLQLDAENPDIFCPFVFDQCPDFWRKIMSGLLVSNCKGVL